MKLCTTLLLCASAFAEAPALLADLPRPPVMPLRFPDPGIAVTGPPLPAVRTIPPAFPKNLHALIQAAARKHRVPAAFIKSIVAAESNFDSSALSSRGAIGLMQLMPGTAQQYGADPTIPEQNLDAGTCYLRVLMNRYRKYRNWMHCVIAAYNAGPAVVDRYRGVPPYPETRIYVARVLSFLRHFQR